MSEMQWRKVSIGAWENSEGSQLNSDLKWTGKGEKYSYTERQTCQMTIKNVITWRIEASTIRYPLTHTSHLEGKNRRLGDISWTSHSSPPRHFSFFLLQELPIFFCCPLQEQNPGLLPYPPVLPFTFGTTPL